MALLEDSPLGRRAADGWGEVSSHALHGAMRNVLELSGRLTEETFFLRFCEGNAGRVTRVLNGLLRGDEASLYKFI